MNDDYLAGMEAALAGNPMADEVRSADYCEGYLTGGDLLRIPAPKVEPEWISEFTRVLTTEEMDFLAAGPLFCFPAGE